MSLGIDLVDEALKWNGTDYKLFDTWFPSILAYYGQSYISTAKKEGKWTMFYDKEDKVWIPEIILNDGFSAWDWRNFYKDLYEGPIPIKMGRRLGRKYEKMEKQEIKTATNSTYPKVAVQWLNQALCFYLCASIKVCAMLE
jgi:hypothetical protein